MLENSREKVPGEAAEKWQAWRDWLTRKGRRKFDVLVDGANGLKKNNHSHLFIFLLATALLEYRFFFFFLTFSSLSTIAFSLSNL